MCGHLQWLAGYLFFHCLFLFNWVGPFTQKIESPVLSQRKTKSTFFSVMLLFMLKVFFRVVYKEYFDEMVETITTSPPACTVKWLWSLIAIISRSLFSCTHLEVCHTCGLDYPPHFHLSQSLKRQSRCLDLWDDIKIKWDFKWMHKEKKRFSQFKSCHFQLISSGSTPISLLTHGPRFRCK